MESLDPSYPAKINEFLRGQGLKFTPLIEDLRDHILCDLENFLSEGLSYEEAMAKITADLPNDHFKQLEEQTMKSIEKRFNVARGFTYLSLLLLLLTSLFKLLHFPGTSLLLMASFFAMGLSLLVSTLSGILGKQKKKGKWMALGVMISILLSLFGNGMQILHLPGGYWVRGLAVLSLTILFPLITIHLYRNRGQTNHLLIFLHQKHTPGIERFLLFMLGMSIAMFAGSTLLGYQANVPQILLVITIGAAGLQFFALNWRLDKSLPILITLIVAFVSFIIPAWGIQILSLSIRVMLVTAFFSLAAVITFYQSRDFENPVFSGIVTSLVGLLYLLWALWQLQVFSLSFSDYLLNIPILVLLLIGLFLVRRHSLLKVFMIVVAAHYLLEYSALLG